MSDFYPSRPERASSNQAPKDPALVEMAARLDHQREALANALNRMGIALDRALGPRTEAGVPSKTGAMPDGFVGELNAKITAIDDLIIYLVQQEISRLERLT